VKEEYPEISGNDKFKGKQWPFTGAESGKTWTWESPEDKIKLALGMLQKTCINFRTDRTIGLPLTKTDDMMA